MMILCRILGHRWRDKRYHGLCFGIPTHLDVQECVWCRAWQNQSLDWGDTPIQPLHDAVVGREKMDA